MLSDGSSSSCKKKKENNNSHAYHFFFFFFLKSCTGNVKRLISSSQSLMRVLHLQPKNTCFCALYQIIKFYWEIASCSELSQEKFLDPPQYMCLSKVPLYNDLPCLTIISIFFFRSDYYYQHRISSKWDR